MSGRNYSAVTDVGLQRRNNEDCIFSDPDSGLWLVADGMGGHAAGEVASRITSEVVEHAIKNGESLESAIQTAHKAVVDAALNGTGKPGMGSTVVALKSRGHHYQIAWVGDSRAYLWSDESGSFSLRQLTIDHSYVQMLYQSGIISEEELSNHPEKNIITQCLGSTELDRLKVDVVERKWGKRDRILLCSDGLSDLDNDQTIYNILSDNEEIQSAVDALLNEALNNGGVDNVSIILIDPPSGIKVSLQASLDQLSGRWKHVNGN